MKKIEHLRKDNVIEFTTEGANKKMVVKQQFDNNVGYAHLTGDIPNKINELVDAVNMLYAYIEQSER